MKKFLMLSIFIFVQGAWGQQLVPTTTTQPSNNPLSYLGGGSSSFQGLTGGGSTTPNCTGTNCLMNNGADSSGVGSAAAGGASTAPNEALADASCSSAKQNLNKICIGNNNPGIQKAVSVIAAVGTAGLSMTDACSKFNDALKVANDAIIVYNAACAAAGYMCQKNCSTAATAAQGKAAGSVGTTSTYWMNVYNADNTTGADCTTSMKANLIDAGIGLAGIAGSSLLGKQCQADTTDTSVACTTATAANGSATNPLCINGIDCSNSANATNPTCICNAAPNSPGCPGATSYGSGASGTSYGSTASGTSGTNTTSTGTTSSTGLSAVTRNATDSTSADGSTAGAGGGGGYGGAISGDSIAASADAKKGQTADKKGTLNPNILSDYDGGGGGGSRGGGSGSSGSGYNAYMPGQKKDPTRALASQNAASSQVTSAGSKSNWEKITERYTENKSTLMGD